MIKIDSRDLVVDVESTKRVCNTWIGTRTSIVVIQGCWLVRRNQVLCSNDYIPMNGGRESNCRN